MWKNVSLLHMRNTFSCQYQSFARFPHISILDLALSGLALPHLSSLLDSLHHLELASLLDWLPHLAALLDSLPHLAALLDSLPHPVLLIGTLTPLPPACRQHIVPFHHPRTGKTTRGTMQGVAQRTPGMTLSKEATYVVGDWDEQRIRTTTYDSVTFTTTIHCAGSHTSSIACLIPL